jgi:hypothetical protein
LHVHQQEQGIAINQQSKEKANQQSCTETNRANQQKSPYWAGSFFGVVNHISCYSFVEITSAGKGLKKLSVSDANFAK